MSRAADTLRTGDVVRLEGRWVGVYWPHRSGPWVVLIDEATLDDIYLRPWRQVRTSRIRRWWRS